MKFATQDHAKMAVCILEGVKDILPMKIGDTGSPYI